MPVEHAGCGPSESVHRPQYSVPDAADESDTESSVEDDEEETGKLDKLIDAVTELWCSLTGDTAHSCAKLPPPEPSESSVICADSPPGARTVPMPKPVTDIRSGR